MVSQDRVAPRQPAEELAEKRFTPSPRNKIAADQRQVGLPFLDPCDGLPHRPRPAGRKTEVEVREVRDAEAVELGRQPPKRHVQRLEAEPPGLEPGVRRARGGSGADQRGQRERAQTSSL